MPIHERATAFAKVADRYERGRPGYPDELVAWLLGLLAAPQEAVVVDLAAGTGKLTRGFAGRVGRLIAVEPIEEMRAQLRLAVPEAEVLGGTAAAIPLPDASVDLLTCAQAFHWFADGESLAGMVRVLRPGGLLAIVWNERRLEQPIQQRLARLRARHEGRSPTRGSSRWRELLEASPALEPVGRFLHPFAQELDLEGMVDRVLSTSSIAALGAAEQAAVAEEVREAVRAEGLPTAAPVSLEYTSEAHVYRGVAR